MTNDFVSVIIPAFNREAFIVDCLNSVYEQSYRPIEVLVVDDGSKDSTVCLAEEFKKQFEEKDIFEVKVLRQINSGAPTARNHGFQQSKGGYIQFFDSDDLLLKEKLAKQVNVLKSSDYDLTYCRALHVDENGDSLNQYWGQELKPDSSKYFDFSWQTMCPLYKRDTILDLGLWNTSLKMNQDWEYNIRAVIKGFHIHYSSEVLCLFKKHNAGNIGGDLGIEKVRSKENSAKVVFELLGSKGLLDDILQSKFRKRFVFCLIHYSILNAKDDFDRLFIQMKDWALDISMLKFLRARLVSKMVYWLYSLR